MEFWLVIIIAITLGLIVYIAKKVKIQTLEELNQNLEIKNQQEMIKDVVLTNNNISKNIQIPKSKKSIENKCQNFSTSTNNSKKNITFEYPQITGKKTMSCPVNYIPDNYVILDLETTGLNPKEDDIIEIGCIKIKEGKEEDSYETFVKPSELIPSRITEITGINNEMIANAPQFNYIANQLWKFLKDEIIVGHNVKFDIDFLNEKFFNSINLNFYNNYLDTLSLSREIYQNLESYKLEDLAKKLKIDFQNHRAIADCLKVKELLDNIMNEIVKNKLLIEIPAYKLCNFNAEIVSEYVINLIKIIEEEDYLRYEIVKTMCDKLVDKDLATAKLCKKMGSVCEKFEEYEEAISFYNSAMDIDPELDFYRKIEKLEKKLYEF